MASHRSKGFSKVRGQEILAWLDAHPAVTHYVILENNVDDFMPPAHTVATEDEIGLTWELAQKAIAILTRR